MDIYITEKNRKSTQFGKFSEAFSQPGTVFPSRCSRGHRQQGSLLEAGAAQSHLQQAGHTPRLAWNIPRVGQAATGTGWERGGSPPFRRLLQTHAAIWTIIHSLVWLNSCYPSLGALHQQVGIKTAPTRDSTSHSQLPTSDKGKNSPRSLNPYHLPMEKG